VILNPLFLLRTVQLALVQIRANIVRSLLTTLGIIIGVASVTSVIAALTGLKDTVLGEIETFGANKMFIFPSRPSDLPANLFPWDRIRLRPEEARLLAEVCPSIRQLTPITSLNATVEHRGRRQDGISVTGIWPTWHAIERRQVISGRPFVEDDEETGRNVCLVNEAAIEELDLPIDPAGSEILINNRRFLVVGLVETLEATFIRGMDTSQSEVFIPFETARRMQNPSFFMHIVAQIVSPEAAEEAQAEARFALRNARQLEPDQPDTFRVQPIDQFIDQFKSVAAVITAIAGGIVAISLLVGGIGIMNIMLVSVSERTREIGLRKALGATPSAILMQFLTEATVLSLLGGAIGLGFGMLLAFAMTLPENGLADAAIPQWAIIMSVGFSGAVGIVFGMFPAIKASRLDPIDALRHE